jgi:hypothetical protein
LERWRELLIDHRSEAWMFPSETAITPVSYSNVYRRNIQPALKNVNLDDVNFQAANLG